MLAVAFVLLFFLVSSWMNHRDRIARIHQALSGAQERIEWAGGLDRVRPKSHEEKVPLTPEQRGKLEKNIGHFVEATAHLERALRIDPTDEQTERLRRQVIETIGRLALRAGKHLLARQAFGELTASDEVHPHLEKLLSRVIASEQSAQIERRAQLQNILLELDRGLSRPHRPAGAPLLDDYLFQAMQHLDIDSVHVLGKDLQRLIDRRQSEPARILWTQEERDRATFICRLLGRLAQPECLDLLIPWITHLEDPQLLVEAGSALCNTRLHSARNTLLTLRQRIGEDSFAWTQIEPYLPRISIDPEVETPPEPSRALEKGFSR